MIKRIKNSVFYRIGIILVLFLLIQLPPNAVAIANRYPHSMLITLLMIGVFLMLFAFIIGWARSLYLDYNQLTPGGIKLGLIFGAYLVLLVGMMFFGRLNLIFFHQAETANNQAIASMLNHNELMTIVFVISACTLTPIAEELIFRGVLTNIFFKPTWFWPKVLLSGLVFSGAHASTNIVSFLTYFFMGLVLAYVYRRSGDLRNSILLHALNNIIAMGALLG